MNFDATAALDRADELAATRPPEPPAGDGFWRAAWHSLTAVPRGLSAATGEAMGTAADWSKAFGAISANAMENDPFARAAVGDDALRAGAQEGRRQLATGEAWTDEGVGRSLRNAADELRPDAATASTAERLVFDFTRVGSKVAAGYALAGPLGVGLAALEQGTTKADELLMDGVADPTVRIAGGTVEAVATAAAALPLAGPSLKATAGLYLVGGPGGFMAQQEAMREILGRAGYAEQAAQYDPLDPVGLALSALIPAPFALHGASRNVRAARTAAPPRIEPTLEPVPQKVVDAAMVHNLTLQQDLTEARIASGEPAIAGQIAPIENNARPELSDDAMPTKADVAAPEVERMRSLTDEQITDTESSLPAAPKLDPLLASISDRIQAVERSTPDMIVRTDESGQPVTAAQEMARVRREAAEGSDAELGALDADLVNVAVNCALSFGTE